MQSSSGSTPTTDTRHIPVLLQEVLSVLNIDDKDIVLDGTLGGGGHARAMANLLGVNGHFIGFDIDSEAIKRTRTQLKEIKAKITLINDNFRNVTSKLSENGVGTVDKALFDLGWSSDQLEVSGRGFTFLRSEPLQMTLSDTIDDNSLTAFEIVNSWDEENIADILYGWGGERHSRKIARAIVKARNENEISTTLELVSIIESVLPRKGKIHPATKTFQALRIAVNDELGALEELLKSIPKITHSGSIVSFITFHSLEDRIVKHTFRTWYQEGMGEIKTNKPIKPKHTEVENNPRARSAKLRVFKFL